MSSWSFNLAVCVTVVQISGSSILLMAESWVLSQDSWLCLSIDWRLKCFVLVFNIIYVRFDIFMRRITCYLCASNSRGAKSRDGGDDHARYESSLHLSFNVFCKDLYQVIYQRNAGRFRNDIYDIFARSSVCPSIKLQQLKFDSHRRTVVHCSQGMG